MRKITGETKFISGDAKVPLTENHRFSTWQKSAEALHEWRKHFERSNISAAIGLHNLGYALYTATIQGREKP